ncbi:AfsR/SARP family transcriptional regulator [Candidatus Syntrophocurvum alkaliphilum]|nr:BTAD domain-containing putative transcriptional regulator [Candidatus Syntrophocurvum alkaliphilum]
MIEQETLKPLVIKTLGKFEISRGTQVYSQSHTRSYKMWELLKYILTYRDRILLPEAIMETLWPEEEYTDPKHALRTLVYRLRTILDIEEPKESTCIKFNQGGYCWNQDSNYELDTEVFERLLNEASAEEVTNPANAIYKYTKALELYKGDYLSENLYQEWVIPIRHYYLRRYLESSKRLLNLLKKEKQYTNIIAICEKALEIDYYDEGIHLFFLDALVKDGRLKQAEQHYQNMSKSFYKELGVKPSIEMQNIKGHLNGETNNTELRLLDIEKRLKDNEESEKSIGAFLCDIDIFNYLYKLECRRAERNESTAILAALSLTDLKYQGRNNENMKKILEHLQELLVTNLRKGDIITSWNDRQCLLILNSLNEAQAESVLKRIDKRFKTKSSKEEVFLRIEMKNISQNTLNA